MQKNKTGVEKKNLSSKQTQRHVHEFEGSTKLAEEGADRHNHRFAGVTGQAIRVGRSHVHEIDLTKTDFVNHFHNLKKLEQDQLFQSEMENTYILLRAKLH